MSLPRSTPTVESVDADGIRSLLDALEVGTRVVTERVAVSGGWHGEILHVDVIFLETPTACT